MIADILLVEDNRDLAKLIKTFLERANYDVILAESGEEAVQVLEAMNVKMVLLDIMLPDMDGFQVCSLIREKDDVPIMIISAKVGKEDKMNGFRLGADDYVEKPVDMEILCAKVGALLARNYERKYKSKLIHSGDIAIDKETKAVYCKSRLLSLTAKEYELLLLLAENEGKTLTKEYLFQKIWGNESFSENQTLTVHIKMLRDKIEDNPRRPGRIVTVWGVGYRYEKI